jgi:hypothetical protein
MSIFDKKQPSSNADGTAQNNDSNTPTPAAPAGVPVVDAGLMQLLLEERAEAAAEKQAERENKRRKALARASGAEDLVAAEKTRVQNCSHLKGGKNRAYNAKTDFAMTQHTFIDSATRIRCSLCGFNVFGPRNRGTVPADSRETIYRDRGNGFEALPNPTYNPERGKPGISYADAQEMLKQTTNQPTQSERVLDNPAAQVAETNTKLTAAQTEIAELRAKLAAAQKQ